MNHRILEWKSFVYFRYQDGVHLYWIYAQTTYGATSINYYTETKKEKKNIQAADYCYKLPKGNCLRFPCQQMHFAEEMRLQIFHQTRTPNTPHSRDASSIQKKVGRTVRYIIKFGLKCSTEHRVCAPIPSLLFEPLSTSTIWNISGILWLILICICIIPFFLRHCGYVQCYHLK